MKKETLSKIEERIMKLSQSDAELKLSTEVLDYLDKGCEDDAAGLYATLLYALLYKDEKLSDFNRCLKPLLVSLINKEGGIANFNYLLINELLHYIHTAFPTAREEGIHKVAFVRRLHYEESNGIIVTFEREFVFVDEFPEKLKERIEKCLAPLRDDLSVTYTTTWMYSHLDGLDYTYKANEHPKVEIYCISNLLLERIKEMIIKEFGEEVRIREAL